MTGGEIVPAVTKAASLAKGALAEDESVKGKLLEEAQSSRAFDAAAEAYARRVAVKQEILLRLFLPLARLVGVSREYFDRDFPADLSRKIADTPEEHLTSPRPSIAVPAMQGLSYSLDEPDLKEMYLNLLATATDDRVSDRAHPSFAEIIKQLSATEAAELVEMLGERHLPVVQLRRVTDANRGSALVHNHVLPWAAEAGGPPVEEPSGAVWVDNWIRLGLVEVNYGSVLTAEGYYDFVDDRPEYKRMVEQSPNGSEGVEVTKGLLRSTDFGLRFKQAVTPPPAQDAATSLELAT